MNLLRVSTVSAASLLLVACVSMPKGPSVMVLPGTGKTFDQFRYDDVECRQFADVQIGGTSPSDAAADSVAKSAVVGTAIGAAAGAALGGRSGAAAGAGGGTLVQAQTAWPSKPIRWIVPFPPGGPADVVTRLVSAKLAERVGQPAIVENRGGAGGNVGHEAAAKAAPDGYTVVFVVPAIITNPFFLKASIDPFKELAPVIHLDSASMVLLTHPAFPASTVAEVIALARASRAG